MSVGTEVPAVAVETAAVAAPVAPAKKAPPKKAASKAAPAKKAPKGKKAPASASNGAAKKDGLRAPQVRILKCLGKNSKPLTRAQISEKAPVDVAACVEYLGSHDAAKRAANDAKHFPSLITLGYVKLEDHPDTGCVYTITAKGTQALAKLPAK